MIMMLILLAMRPVVMLVEVLRCEFVCSSDEHCLIEFDLIHFFTSSQGKTNLRRYGSVPGYQIGSIGLLARRPACS